MQEKYSYYSTKYFLRHSTQQILQSVLMPTKLESVREIDKNIISVNPLVDSLPSETHKLPSRESLQISTETDGRDNNLNLTQVAPPAAWLVWSRWQYKIRIWSKYSERPRVGTSRELTIVLVYENMRNLSLNNELDCSSYIQRHLKLLRRFFRF